MLRFGILDKHSFPEVPPRVEYSFTSFGERFLTLIDEVERLQRTLETTAPSTTAPEASP
jgi:DNA-binding HxlR family transcriptional regulator